MVGPEKYSVIVTGLTISGQIQSQVLGHSKSSARLLIGHTIKKERKEKKLVKRLQGFSLTLQQYHAKHINVKRNECLMLI